MSVSFLRGAVQPMESSPFHDVVSPRFHQLCIWELVSGLFCSLVCAVVLPGALLVQLNGASLFTRPLSCLAFLDPLCFPGNCTVGLSFSTHRLVQIGVGVLLTLGRVCLLVVPGGGGTRGLSVCLLPSGCLCRC